MRTLGVTEKFITGDARDDEKFFAWAKGCSFHFEKPLVPLDTHGI